MSASQPINVRDMAIVHRLFRQAYDESARLARAAPAPSPGRVTFLAITSTWSSRDCTTIIWTKTPCYIPSSSRVRPGRPR
jgi:hypothetical protein